MQEPVDPAVLADMLKISPHRLRALIRQHRLAPKHVKRTRYKFTAEDLARIKRHPAVSRAAQRAHARQP